MQGKSRDGNWFMIMCSWEQGADAEAVEKFEDVYKNYLLKLTESDWQSTISADDPRLDLNSESIKALNLIGRRTFVIICQAASNRVLQELSRNISLKAPVSVKIFPATDVHDLFKMFVRHKDIS